MQCGRAITLMKTSILNYQFCVLKYYVRPKCNYDINLSTCIQTTLTQFRMVNNRISKDCCNWYPRWILKSIDFQEKIAIAHLQQQNTNTHMCTTQNVQFATYISPNQKYDRLPICTGNQLNNISVPVKLITSLLQTNILPNHLPIQ